ncbi:hypothetical protein [Clostridium sporogenes]|uniref:hypothetical protein n=1 Tax=Clostridium sporogenes TaxID=1509 RepID=UPI0013D680FE|nr:hypothetical protein [Clostridium sporogenes]MBW5458723.1 hypothetical protein [Clostridium sporogenes]UBI11031.1 hypothetical protein LA336_13840 [Clostridium sporogenes]
MELDTFFQELKENLPDKVIDISESLELIKETINDTKVPSLVEYQVHIKNKFSSV